MFGGHSIINPFQARAEGVVRCQVRVVSAESSDEAKLERAVSYLSIMIGSGAAEASARAIEHLSKVASIGETDVVFALAAVY